MSFNTPQFTPADIERHCFIISSTLRDWRLRDFSKHLGTVGDNGRWKYSAVDMVELAIANLASRSGLSDYLSFKVARDCAPIVFHFWGARVTPSPGRFAFFWRRTPVTYATPIDQMFDWDMANDLSEIENELSAISFVFDGQKYASDYEQLGAFLKDRIAGETS